MPFDSFDEVIPDTQICLAARDLVRDLAPGFLYRHSMRSFGFGYAAGQAMQRSFDPEMLFLGAVLHDLGLVEDFIRDDRFELDGADAAAEFLSRQGYSDRKIAVIWDAIALHTTPSIPQRKCAEIALVQIGAGLDVGVVPPDMLKPDAVQLVVEAFPRGDFGNEMLASLAKIVERKPDKAMFTFLSDVGETCVHDFHAPSFVDLVRGAAF